MHQMCSNGNKKYCHGSARISTYLGDNPEELPVITISLTPQGGAYTRALKTEK